MIKVYCVGGTNHGAVLNVKHGSRLSLPRKKSLPHAVVEVDCKGVSPLPACETYVRPPSGVTVVNGVERWLLARD